MAPGIHVGVPMADYLNEPAVNASLLNTLLARCPKAAWYESWLNPKPEAQTWTAEQSIGTAAHALLLEGSRDCVVVINPQDHPNEKGGGFAAGWTNKSIKAARAAAIAAEKVALLPPEMECVEAMVAAARAYIDTLRESEPAIWMALQPSGGESEVVIRWDERDGTRCKIRPDRITHDRRVVVDYKTTGSSAEPDAWFKWQGTRLGYPVSAAFYRRGIKAAAGVDADYVWFVQEQDPPYLCSLVGLEPSARALSEKKMLRGLQTWSACASSKRWHAYPSRVAYVELPPWEFAREEEREPSGGIPYDPAHLGWREARDFVDSLPDQ